MPQAPPKSNPQTNPTPKPAILDVLSDAGVEAVKAALVLAANLLDGLSERLVSPERAKKIAKAVGEIEKARQTLDEEFPEPVEEVKPCQQCGYVEPDEDEDEE